MFILINCLKFFDIAIMWNNTKHLTNPSTSQLTHPFLTQAQDDDLRGSSNSQVRYQIVDGDRNKNFTINQLTGEIRPRNMVDFEKMGNERGDTRTFRLKVRAYDLGTPSLYSDVPVVVYVQVSLLL